MKNYFLVTFLIFFTVEATSQTLFQPIEKILFEKDFNQWQNSLKTELVYDSLDRLIGENNFNWYLGNWEQSFRRKLDYNEVDSLIEEILLQVLAFETIFLLR